MDTSPNPETDPPDNELADPRDHVSIRFSALDASAFHRPDGPAGCERQETRCEEASASIRIRSVPVWIPVVFDIRLLRSRKEQQAERAPEGDPADTGKHRPPYGETLVRLGLAGAHPTGKR